MVWKCVTLCYDDTNSGVYCIVTNDFCADISHDVDRRFDTSSYPQSIDRPVV